MKRDVAAKSYDTACLAARYIFLRKQQRAEELFLVRHAGIPWDRIL